ncbi:MAG TPA: TrkA C-terminal domain-containing protein [Terriglobales bacterium]
MATVISTLAGSPVLTLFVVIGLGYLLGHVRIFGFRFGISGVLFVGIAIGALSPTITLPEIISTFGLILFVYTIGIQSGPAFFASFNQQGARNNLLAICVLVMGSFVASGLGMALHYSAPRVAGLYAGALTNTPAVAAAQERIKSRAQQQGLPPEQIRQLTDQPIVSFGLAYPMGIIGLMLAFQVLRRVWRVDEQPSEPELPTLRSSNFAVRNPALFGHTIGQVMQVHSDAGFTISRVRHNGEIQVFRPEIELADGDVVVAIGDNDAIERARFIFGEPSEDHIELERTELALRRVLVSSPDVVGKRLEDLNLQQRLGATITRIRRGDHQLVPSPDTRLEFGDMVRVLGKADQLEAVSQFFGDSIKGTAETDFGSVAIGMVLGALAGMIPIPIPGGQIVRLGLAGGPLLVALILGKVERTGRITWTMPISANLTLRQIGLLLFLAGVGTRAGYSFAQTLRTNGVQIILAGAVITFAVSLTTLVVAHKVLKMPFDSAMGMVSGIHTEPASLTFAAQVSRSDRPNIAYTTVYPVAMIGKIILAQLLA